MSGTGRTIPAPWRILSSSTVFEIPHRLRVNRQTVLTDKGAQVDDFYKFDMARFVIVFAMTADQMVICVRHYRHGPEKICLELPSGHIEQGESVLTAGRRELLEETGYTAEHWRELPGFAVAGNQGCGEGCYLIATGARKTAPPASGDLENSEVLLCSPDDLQAALLDGRVGVLPNALGIAFGLLFALPPAMVPVAAPI